MPNCVNDFSPLIAAIATVLTVQFPVIITLLVNQVRIKSEIARSKDINMSIEKKTDLQTAIMDKGFQNSTCLETCHYKTNQGGHINPAM